ncbi:hypothetical protein [Thiorhodovibrio frisius]|uniref:Uncharacterized protein n=1 Tax=Thiorhodovibrio frisius TaxID=631362 RepID=H8YX06_9GAMM|nr:hypothetical protein [Thiorhodovibrio frisius]EIC22982.1 hypothetical protein Thi970DRAFT_00631 [Thiorhodovibrio frisius]WPL22751.1 hypothetical protein Thiofri_02921 [Thiorhodovibrio frisius]
MTAIANDQQLRALLQSLPAADQRRLGLGFVESVLHLCQDERVKRAIATGQRADATADELEDAYRDAKAWATKTYTDCGKETDWLAQADHFVAAAAAAALMPDALLTDKTNRAWKAAMQARMANTCELVEAEDSSAEGEAERQYRIAAKFAPGG